MLSLLHILYYFRSIRWVLSLFLLNFLCVMSTYRSSLFQFLWFFSKMLQHCYRSRKWWESANIFYCCPIVMQSCPPADLSTYWQLIFRHAELSTCWLVDLLIFTLFKCKTCIVHVKLNAIFFIKMKSKRRKRKENSFIYIYLNQSTYYENNHNLMELQ